MTFIISLFYPPGSNIANDNTNDSDLYMNLTRVSRFQFNCLIMK